MKRTTAGIFALLAGLALASIVRADDPPHRHHGPPPQAIEACAGLAEGAACTVTFRENAHAGVCRLNHEGQPPLACHPNDRPHHPHE